MKKKKTFGLIFKRTFLSALLIVVIICTLVFIFDKYDASSSKYSNKYEDSYWDQDKVDGFEYYDDIIKRINKFDYKAKEYETPFAQAVDNDEIYQLARYKEELSKRLAAEINKLKTDSDKAGRQAKNLIEDAGGYTIEEYIEEFIGLTVNDYKDVSVDGKGFEFIKNHGYTKTIDDYVSALKNDKYDLFRNLKNDGYTGTDLELAKAIYIDDTASCVKAITSLSDEELQTYYDLCNERDDLKSQYETENIKYGECFNNLPDWDTYKKTTLLGYGGLATDYPNKPVLETTKDNGNKLQLWFNTYLTTFKLKEVDESGNLVQEWLSNPEEEDPLATSGTKRIENSIMRLSYSVLNGETGTYSSYEHSVLDKNPASGDFITPQYAVKIDPETNTLMVLYQFKSRGVNYTYFPKYISEARMKELIARSTQRASEGVEITDINNIAYGVVAKDLADKKNNYELGALTQSIYKLVEVDSAENERGYAYYEYKENMANMSGITLKRLAELLYGWCGYTEEDLETDNLEFGYEVSYDRPEYRAAIEYVLNEKGLQITIPGNSIKEDKKYPLTDIEILPYFTATKMGISGYTVIPDGSGAIMNHDNGNTSYSKYEKRVYSTDLAYESVVDQGNTNDLMFPMYAVVNTGNTSGMLVYGSTVKSQLQLTADVSGRNDSYNKNYFTCYLRESKKVIIGTSYYAKRLTKWSNARVKDDIVLNYEVLNSDELSYSSVAKKYRDILVNEYDMDNSDATNTPVLNIDVIGSYSYKDNFIGIPYTQKDSLTTISQLETMIDEIKDTGVSNINVSYLGWRTEGLKNESFSSIKVSKEIGSKKKLTALINDEQEQNVTIYPFVEFAEYTNFKESFGNNHYTTRGVDGDMVVKYPYDINTNTYNKKATKIRVLSPRYYYAFAQELANNYTKLLDVPTLSINGLGSSLVGDYKKGIETFKNDAMIEQIKSFEYLVSKGVNQFTLNAPYDFAFKYASVIKNVPYTCTQYEIFDYSIPFYQLVCNGLIDYSGESVNAYSEKGINEHLMRMIETGSNMAFTFTYDSSEKLLQTDYNEYYYTLYTDWLNDVKQIYNTLSDLGIYKGEFIAHEQLASNIYKVTYLVDGNEKDIYLNYTRNSYTTGEGIVVAAKSYAVGR